LYAGEVVAVHQHPLPFPMMSRLAPISTVIRECASACPSTADDARPDGQFGLTIIENPAHRASDTTGRTSIGVYIHAFRALPLVWVVVWDLGSQP